MAEYRDPFDDSDDFSDGTESSVSSYDYDLTLMDGNGLEDIKRTAHESLNLGNGYQGTWYGQEAFREFYQNWRDGIVRSFNIDPSDFRTETQTLKMQIIIRAISPHTKNLMGYIQFKWDKNNLGTLQLVNFNAALHKDHLVNGGTTKAYDKTQSGQYGEGMKLAALIMRRRPQNHTVRILSSGFMWNFSFNSKAVLTCTLTKEKEDKLRKLKAKEEDRKKQHKPRELKPNIWEDVAVQIGSGRSERTQDRINQRKKKSDKIRLADFKRWLEVSIDIAPPTNIVRTREGDLILNREYKNKTYLKGLLLPNSSVSGKPLKYGYNFREGDTSRDRTSMAYADDEAFIIAKIWGAALRADGDIFTEDSLIARYTKLLEKTFGGHKDYADVHDADCHASESTVKKVWAYMLSPAKYRNGKAPFYYSPTDSTDASKIIRDCLKREPVLVEERLWNMFCRHHLCRTPDKERYHRFHKAALSDLSNATCFANHMLQTLAACLRSDPATSDMKLSFVDTRDLGLDVIYLRKERMWKINDKWLTFDGAHEHTACVLDQDDTRFHLLHELFLCDHAATSLFRIMIDELSGQDTGNTPLKELKIRLESNGSIRIPQMVRAVRLSVKPEALMVTWKSSGRLAMISGHCKQQTSVVLHRTDTCRDKRNIPLYREEEESCDCPKQTVPPTCHKALFNNLSADHFYFPMICTAEHGSFYAVPPPSKRPLNGEETAAAGLKKEPSETDLVHISSGDSSSDSDIDASEPFSPGLQTPIESPRTASRPSTRHSFPQSATVDRTSHSSPIRATPDKDLSNIDDVLSQLRDYNSKAQEALKSMNTEAAWRILFETQIEHKDLGWEAFPGNHDWYRAINRNGQSGFFARSRAPPAEDETYADSDYQVTAKSAAAALQDMERCMLTLSARNEKLGDRELREPRSSKPVKFTNPKASANARPTTATPHADVGVNGSAREDRAISQDSLYRLTPRPQERPQLPDQGPVQASVLGISRNTPIRTIQSVTQFTGMSPPHSKRAYCESVSDHDGKSENEENSTVKRFRHL
ncbi:uncharacterized protein BDZ99DRAFT_168163 [Mytilinidion resinicola]|uniref:Uncharacterized protein n=1 Tax=Mytilinidion resinicola TaxID=574789 RepID=A0A6A6Y6J3_9PEZI|nr:uncharacterized protein BDZ99DRAFT_168163 [Mytilinidion resinicola]KAF2803634.1 hypothetical protein BDZ99DRAFT_168163 [Mytilinidion resinicola]